MRPEGKIGAECALGAPSLVHNGQCQDYPMTSKSGVADSRIIFKNPCSTKKKEKKRSLLQVHDHYQKIMSYNVVKKMTIIFHHRL
jgi:hypothetical protein